MNSRIILLLGIALIAAILLSGCAQNTQTTGNNNGSGNTNTSGSSNGNAGGTATVEISNFAFAPAELSVKKGTTVKWINKDSVQHTATADDASFDSGLLEQGQEWSKTFNETGTFTYLCTPHPYMKGKITVTE